MTLGGTVRRLRRLPGRNDDLRALAQDDLLGLGLDPLLQTGPTLALLQTDPGLPPTVILAVSCDLAPGLPVQVVLLPPVGRLLLPLQPRAPLFLLLLPLNAGQPHLRRDRLLEFLGAKVGVRGFVVEYDRSVRLVVNLRQGVRLRLRLLQKRIFASGGDEF